jgi:hypothetical protein
MSPVWWVTALSIALNLANAAWFLWLGIPKRVAKLRAAGSAIVPQVAAEFIKAVMGIATACKRVAG